MSYAILQKNLEKLIKDRNYQIVELERKAGLKKNNIYNIVKGISKKPSAELLQSVADALGTTVKDLYNPSIEISEHLTDNDFTLLEDALKSTIEEGRKVQIKITETELINIVLEVYKYTKTDSGQKIDKKFINWLLNQHISKK